MSITRAADAPTVSVIVVNYNGIAFLEPLLASLERAFERYTHETVVVDNASFDGSTEWLRGRGDIRLVALGSNTGFTGGNNVGARHARGEVLLLLNADTEVMRPLDALVDLALRDDIGAAGCQLRYGDGRLQHSIGLEHHVLRLALSWLGLEHRVGAPAVFRKCESDPACYAAPRAGLAWVSGACLATRASVWQQLGGLDPAYFMYCEDVDYCRRARALGLGVAYTPESLVTHHEGGGKAWIGGTALLRTARAYQIYTAKTSGRWAARGLCTWLALVFTLRAAAFAVRDMTREVRRDVTPDVMHDVTRDATTPAERTPDLAGSRPRAYLRAARSLLGAALTGRLQPCP